MIGNGEGKTTLSYLKWAFISTVIGLALGAWLGWQALPIILLLSSLVGAVIGISLIALHKHHQGKPIPFGPYLAIAGWIALLWGDTITRWYLTTIL